jgi:hypothetical protein
MKTKHRVWMWLLLATGAAFGQGGSAARRSSPLIAASSAPTITILSAATGALVRGEGTGNAALDLGKVSYFRGTSVAGESSQKTAGALVISTRFALKVDCPGSSSAWRVKVTMSRTSADASHVLAIDGIKLGTMAQPLEQSMPCGSTGEHRLDLEVPVSTPAGSVASTVAFTATLQK